MQIGVDAHPHPYIGMVGGIINQPSGQYMCVSVVFCVVW